MSDRFLAYAKACYSEFFLTKDKHRKLIQSKARADREKVANVPFRDCEVPPTTASSGPPPLAPRVVKTPVAPGQAIKPAARKRKNASAASKPSPKSNINGSSDNDGDEDSIAPEDSMLDSAEYTVGGEEDEDDTDIFSPTLSPDRLIVDSKVTSDGLTLYKTAKGEWLSEIQLKRLANIARNSRLLMELGLEDAKLSLRPRGLAADEDKEPEAEGDREFSVARARTSIIPRKSHPRASKKDVT